MQVKKENYNWKSIVGTFFVTAIILSAILIVVNTGKPSITGFFGYQPDQVSANTTENPNLPPAQPTPNTPQTPTITPTQQDTSTNQTIAPQSSSATGGGSSGRTSGGGGSSNPQPQFLGYKIKNLKQGFSVKKSGILINDSTDYFQGIQRIALYKGENQFAEFDIVFNDDFDMNDVEFDYNELNKKILFKPKTSRITNTTLYIPREENDTQIRLCYNVSTLQEIHQHCDNASSEEIITLLDNHLSKTPNGKSFKIDISKEVGIASELDSVAPTVNLISPLNEAGSLSDNVKFDFNTADASSTSSCTVLLDDEPVDSLTEIQNFQQTRVTLTNVSAGKHTWKLACLDRYGNVQTTQPRTLKVIKSSLFKGKTTDLSKLNLSRVENFTLELPTAGILVFNEPIDLSEVNDIESHVLLGKKTIKIDSDVLPQLNKSAKVTFYNPEVKNPAVFRDNMACDDCVITKNGNQVTIEVKHFTTYVISENARLMIFDTTDMQTKIPGDTIIHYANYTNATSGAPITGISCQVTFSDTGTQAMAYNGASMMYEYSRSYSSMNTFSYFVECDGSSQGFTKLNGTDFVSILTGTGSGPRGAATNFIKSETAPADVAGNDSALAGNVTEVSINAIATTQSWQGYFGNVSGTVELADSGGNILYNWSQASPKGEVYASRAISAHFPSVMCANETQIIQEENYLGMNESDPDNINHTFSAANHKVFYIGSTQINQDECKSINLYGPNGQQSETFSEVLLGDRAMNIIYASLLEKDASGFDNNSHDFEMIVGENGHAADTEETLYYFFIEIS